MYTEVVHVCHRRNIDILHLSEVYILQCIPPVCPKLPWGVMSNHDIISIKSNSTLGIEFLGIYFVWLGIQHMKIYWLCGGNIYI